MIYDVVALYNDFENVIEEISNMEKPVGILIFGPRSQLKDIIYRKILNNSGRIFGQKICNQEGYSLVWTRIEQNTTENGTIIKLDGDASSQYGESHQILLGLKSSGMRNIVSIHVKAQRDEIVRNSKPVVEKHPSTIKDLTMFTITADPSPLT